jgi:hypothetical protein
MQNEAPPQTPAVVQKDEQHSPLPAHALPVVLHVVLSGVHVLVPGSHLPLQHSPSLVHAIVSPVH